MLIKGGTIIDGSGQKMFKGDIRVEGEKITNISEKLKERGGEETIDAQGLYITPGFVDILNHSDAFLTLFSNPAQESLLRQGITTILMGNCGSSLAPLVDGVFINSIQKWGDPTKINLNWLSVKEYLQELQKHKFGVNLATLVGHSTVRRGLLGSAHRALNEEELKQMDYMVDKGLKEGAFGVSAGLAYTHAKGATEKELMSVASIAKKHKALFSVHLRNEANGFLESVKEVSKISKETGVNTEISHLKVTEETNWGMFTEALDVIKEQKNVTFDVYPYKTTATVLYTFLPNWASEGGNAGLMPNIKNPETRKKLIREMKADPHSYADMEVASGAVHRTYFGKKIKDIAENQDTEPEEAVLNLILASGNRIIVFTQSISEDNLSMGLTSSQGFVSSDGVGYKEDDSAREGNVHPRYFGSMPRFLGEFVALQKLLAWENAVNKITKGPAKKIGLQGRGEIKKGNFADLVLVNPKKVASNATFEAPYKYPTGIDYVIVNGKVAIEKGELKELSGKTLKRS